jgi:hypothetical protein
MEEMFRAKLPLTPPPLRSAHPLPVNGARGNGERAAHPFSPSERGEGAGRRMRGIYTKGGPL